MDTKYNSDNVFAKIIAGKLPCDKVYEDDDTFAFKDINPEAPTHVLVIPKKGHISFNDFIMNTEENKVASFFKTVREIAAQLGLEKDGYRIVTNHGRNASQTVFHFHVHILGGAPLGRLASAI